MLIITLHVRFGVQRGQAVQAEGAGPKLTSSDIRGIHHLEQHSVVSVPSSHKQSGKPVYEFKSTTYNPFLKHDLTRNVRLVSKVIPAKSNGLPLK